MKQNIMKSLLMLVLALLILPVMSQDDMRIYFKDGTNRQIFLREVNGITTSQIDENGTIHSDAYYQHVETTLGELVFDLSEIDSISFAKYDEAVVKENVQKAMTSIMPSLNECQSISDAEKIIDQLKEIETIKDVRSNGEILYVDIDKYGTISFDFGDQDYSSNTRAFDEEIIGKQLSNVKKLNKTDGSSLKIAIANQAYYDEDRAYVIDKINKLKGEYSKCNVEITEETPSIDFYKSKMFEYDVVFLITHGGYDKDNVHSDPLHSLLTANELGMLLKKSDDEETPSNFSQIMIDNFWELIDKYHASVQQINVGYRCEKRNGKYYWVCNVLVFDPFFDKNGVADGYFSNDKSILFNAACHSLEGNDNLATFLRNRGLGIYIGYDGTNTIGHNGGYNFLLHLIYGQSVAGAYNSIPDKYRSQWISDNNIQSYTEIHMIPESDEYYNSTFITPTCTNEKDENSINQEYKDKKYVIAEGITTFLDDNPDGLTCGFEYGPSKYIYDRVVDGTFVQSYKSDKGNRLFTAKLSDLEPGQTYYYRAYTYDGLYYNYGEPCSFTIKKQNNGNTACPDSHHPHMIDLGLPSGIQWACCNVDASSPEDFGGYYAWGETEEKDVYGATGSYLYGDFYLDSDMIICFRETIDIGSNISNTKYDVASVRWGDGWRMPNKHLIEELIENTTTKWTTRNGVDGLLVTSKRNDATLFFPHSGFLGTDFRSTALWGSTLETSLSSDKGHAYAYGFEDGSNSLNLYPGMYRWVGLNVRAVKKP